MSLLEKVYEDNRETSKIADKLVFLLIGLILVGGLLIGTAFAESSDTDVVGSKAYIAETLGGTEINISQFSGLITDSFNDMVARNLDEPERLDSMMSEIDNRATLSTIGNVFGIQSKNAQAQESSNVFTQGDDQSSRRVTLNTVEGWYNIADETELSKLNDSKMTQYIMFGSALNYMGIDEFRDAQGNGDGLRMIIGYAIYICFMLAYSASGIMNAMLEMLKNTNVFARLHNTLVGAEYTHGADDSAIGGMTSGTGTIDGDYNYAYFGASGGELFNTLQNVYNVLVKYRWVVIGIMLVLFVASITVFKSKQAQAGANNQRRLRDIGLRIVIAAIGIPLVGMVYSTVLDLVMGGAQSTKYVVTDFIYTQFLDFEDWVVTNPDNAFIGLDGMKVTYSTDSQTMDIEMPSGPDDYTGATNFSKVVYEINLAMYEDDIIKLGYEQVGHTVDLFEAEGQGVKPATFGKMIANAKIGDGGSRSEAELTDIAYKKARDLILGYARSNTVVSDVLNNRYTVAYSDYAKKIFEGAEELTDEDRTTLRKIMLRIFENAASTYRLWSHDSWNNGPAGSLPDPYTLDGYGDKRIYAQGIPIFPSGKEVGIFVGSGGGSGDLAAGDAVLSGGTMVATGEVTGSGDTRTYSYTYNEAPDNAQKGMSTLALYNYMHSRFSLGTLDMYTPDLTTNSGVSTMHYSITTPYSGVPEIVSLLYTVVMLFSIGIIGWVFGMSMLLNTMVQMLKAIPIIFKMAIGSIQGFVEALLTVLSIVAELFATMALYILSVHIIDFMIAVGDRIMQGVLSAFLNVDPESMSIVNNLLSIAIIAWGTFEIIKWRQAITMTIKSIFTHTLNQIFGTSAAMPTGASSGMLKAAAIGGAAVMTANALADQGALDDVINDMTGSDLGSSIGDKMADGDYAGAWNDVKDYANGQYGGDVRGGSTMDREAADRGLSPMYDEDGNRVRNDAGEAMYEDTKGNQYAASEVGDLPDNWQNLTDDQQASMDQIDGEIEAARRSGNDAEAQRLEAKRAGMSAQYRNDNYNKAKEAGVADWATYEKSLADSEKEAFSGYGADYVEPLSDLPETPSKQLDSNGAAAYSAARTGDAGALRNSAQHYDGAGMDAGQREVLDQMVLDGASEADMAAAIDNFAQQNFGDDYADVIAKMNEAAGRSGNVTYGSNDNSSGNARTVHVERTGGAGAMAYSVTDNNGGDGAQTIVVQEDGEGGVNYVNTTAGGGAANTIQTMDMGSAVTPGDALAYGMVYNSVASMVKAGGGDTSATSLGMGGAANITVTEMAAKSSQMQMAASGLEVNVQGYGDSSNIDVGNAMMTSQVQAAAQSASSGGRVQAPRYTPLTVSSAVGEATGVTVYDVEDTGSDGRVQLRSAGGASGGRETVHINYSGSGSAGINASRDGSLNMVERAAEFAAVMHAIDGILDGGDNSGDTTTR